MSQNINDILGEGICIVLRALLSVAHLHDKSKISEAHVPGNFGSVLFRICGCGTLRGLVFMHLLRIFLIYAMI